MKSVFNFWRDFRQNEWDRAKKSGLSGTYDMVSMVSLTGTCANPNNNTFVYMPSIPFTSSSVFRGEPLGHLPSLEIANMRNQRQIQSEDLFLTLKRIFLLSIFDCGCYCPPFKNPRYATAYNI